MKAALISSTCVWALTVAPSYAFSTGCDPIYGSAISFQDCIQELGSMTQSNLDESNVFRRENGQRRFNEKVYSFSLPRGFSRGTCALGVDLLGERPSPLRSTWRDLLLEMTKLTKDCVVAGQGIGGNSTWRGFVFVLANPTMVDTMHTCMALPDPEDAWDLGQCIAHRASRTDSRQPLGAFGPAGGARSSTGYGPHGMPVPKGFDYGDAFMEWDGRSGAETGLWAHLPTGYRNPVRVGSRDYAWVYNGVAWHQSRTPNLPLGGGMVSLPTGFEWENEPRKYVWHRGTWVPSLAIAPPEHEPILWTHLAGRWTTAQSSLRASLPWILEEGVWMRYAGSWVFQKFTPPPNPRANVPENLSPTLTSELGMATIQTPSRESMNRQYPELDEQSQREDMLSPTGDETPQADEGLHEIDEQFGNFMDEVAGMLPSANATNQTFEDLFPDPTQDPGASSGHYQSRPDSRKRSRPSDP